jgi:uncharacterized protein YbbC (DUF1343 family)
MRLLYFCFVVLHLMVCQYGFAGGYHPGAHQTKSYFPLLKGKRIGLVVNQTSTIGSTHLVDSLLATGISIKIIFAPEHGYRGMADAGEHVKNGKDDKTGIPLVSLYGNHVKPTKVQLQGIDMVVFDIQDVGVRFYTYLSTLHYVMEACAEQRIPLIVLDRPNPNGFYIDGPVMEPKYMSFVGLHPVPIVYGMTIGEYANMINGEGWLKNRVKCRLTVIKNGKYDRTDTDIQLPIKPSPNLPNKQAVYYYPSLCLFEGTIISVGRGTEKPFQLFGHPLMKTSNHFSYTPVSMPGAKEPLLKDQACFGFDLTEDTGSFRSLHHFNLQYLMYAFKNTADSSFFLSNGFFEKLAGTADLRKHIIRGTAEKEIRASWLPGLAPFYWIRKKYLLYK